MTTAERKAEFSRWVVTGNTPDTLTLESRRPTGPAWWLYVVAGVLILVMLNTGSGLKLTTQTLIGLGLPLFLVYYGFRQREPRGGRLLVDTSTQTVTVEPPPGGVTTPRVVPFGSVERLWVQKRFLGWRLRIIHTGGAPIDVTPPEDTDLKHLRATAELLAARIGVEANVVL